MFIVKNYDIQIDDAYATVERAAQPLLMRWGNRPEYRQLMRIVTVAVERLDRLKVAPNPSAGAQAEEIARNAAAELETVGRALQAQLDQAHASEGLARRHAEFERFVAEHSPAQLIDLVEQPGRHVAVLLTADGQLAVRGLRELDHHLRYALEARAEDIKALLRERDEVLIITSGAGA